MPVEVLRFKFDYFYGLIGSVHQAVAGNGSVVALAACGVESPVFRYAEVGVVAPLVSNVVFSRALGGHLQHEVGRLTQVPDGVPVLLNGLRLVHVEGDQQVGDAVALGLAGGPSDRDFAKYDGGVVLAQVFRESLQKGRPVQVERILHIVSGWEVGKPFQCPCFP